jgi:Peptidase family C50
MPRPLLTSALQSRDLFIYFGHGAGEEYLPPASLRRLPTCAAALLIGCSSGRLRPAGRYEPCGTVLMYLSAGEDLAVYPQTTKFRFFCRLRDLCFCRQFFRRVRRIAFAYVCVCVCACVEGRGDGDTHTHTHTHRERERERERAKTMMDCLWLPKCSSHGRHQKPKHPWCRCMQVTRGQTWKACT